MEAIHYTKNMLETMKEIDVRTVERDTLVDIRDIEINPSLPKKDKVLQFIRQIRNPYCYRCGNFIIKVSFANTDISLQDRLNTYIRSKC